MAEAFFNHLAAQRASIARAEFGRSLPGGQVNPIAVEAMQEWASAWRTPAQAAHAEMAAGQTASSRWPAGRGTQKNVPGRHVPSEDWACRPARAGTESVRPIRDAVRERVTALLTELGRQGGEPEGGMPRRSWRVRGHLRHRLAPVALALRRPARARTRACWAPPGSRAWRAGDDLRLGHISAAHFNPASRWGLPWRAGSPGATRCPTPSPNWPAGSRPRAPARCL